MAGSDGQAFAEQIQALVESLPIGWRISLIFVIPQIVEIRFQNG